MKVKTLLILMVVAFAALACSKEEEPTFTAHPNLVGMWRGCYSPCTSTGSLSSTMFENTSDGKQYQLTYNGSGDVMKKSSYTRQSHPSQMDEATASTYSMEGYSEVYSYWLEDVTDIVATKKMTVSGGMGYTYSLKLID